MGKLQGKVCLITGAASGIGRATAELFVREGASVAAVDINEAVLTAAVDGLAGLGPILGVVADVSSLEDAGRALERAIERFGKVDVLFCDAGITSVMPIMELSEEEWDRVIATNLKGMFTMVKTVAPHMKSLGGGTIVTMGSELGIVAVPESPAYGASKGGVIQFTKSVALDLIRYNIRVNAICPGITRTPLLQAEVDNSLDPEGAARAQATWAPIGRVADPAEIARGVLFLATDDSSFAVGSCLVLDGGFTAR